MASGYWVLNVGMARVVHAAVNLHDCERRSLRVSSAISGHERRKILLARGLIQAIRNPERVLAHRGRYIYADVLYSQRRSSGAIPSSRLDSTVTSSPDVAFVIAAASPLERLWVVCCSIHGGAKCVIGATVCVCVVTRAARSRLCGEWSRSYRCASRAGATRRGDYRLGTQARR